MLQNLVYLTVEIEEFVATVTFSNPPNNHFNVELISELLLVLKTLDKDDQCRAIVIASLGDVFCAGGDFGRGENGSEAHISLAAQLYAKGMELFKVNKPMIAAVQGAAVGGGLGLALVADFRVTCEEARFCANFTRLGMHPGFGTTHTLPRLIGNQFAQLMFYTGRRIKGSQAVDVGLADVLVKKDQVRVAAIELAKEIATSAPIAVCDTRASLRLGMAEKVIEANLHELEMQKKHMLTDDFREGLISTQERRKPNFKGS
jgi:enoyl-CoA hydratase/carnithine racemase